MTGTSLPPPAQMMQLVTGAWVSQSVGAAARLGLADHLGSGPKTAEELARASGANPDALFRLMRALASVGVFAMADGRFSLTALGQTLRDGVPGSMRNIAIAETDDVHWLSWGKLTKSIREGRKMSTEAVGMEAWEYYGKHPEDAEQFSRAMSDISAMAIEPVLGAYDFGTASKVVDVGGAHGSLLAAVLAKHPSATGVLFDLPHVVDGSKKAVEARGLSPRIEVTAGSFFESVPAGGDVYLLKHILHDWNDERSVAILRTVRAAMKPTSKVLVVEFALPEAAEPSMAHFMDLNMLVMLDGRERSASQYASLFSTAGLELARTIPTKGPMGIFEAVAG